jgi:hypothetical protein
MLTPNKSLNLDTSVLRVSALMLRELQKRGVIEFERLRGFILRRVGSDGGTRVSTGIDLSIFAGSIGVPCKKRYNRAQS